MQAFTGLSNFSVLLLMALGLAIIFGQMGVINMAHGEFLTVGAYTTYLLSQVSERWAPWLSQWYFLLAIAVAFVLAGALGLAVEHLLVRRLYRRPLDTLLATWGLSLVMQQAFRSTFGAREVSATLPQWLMGSLKPTATIDIPSVCRNRNMGKAQMEPDSRTQTLNCMFSRAFKKSIMINMAAFFAKSRFHAWHTHASPVGYFSSF